MRHGLIAPTHHMIDSMIRGTASHPPIITPLLCNTMTHCRKSCKGYRRNQWPELSGFPLLSTTKVASYTKTFLLSFFSQVTFCASHRHLSVPPPGHSALCYITIFPISITTTFWHDWLTPLDATTWLLSSCHFLRCFAYSYSSLPCDAKSSRVTWVIAVLVGSEQRIEWSFLSPFVYPFFPTALII